MRKWIDISLEEDVRFFVTALGLPLVAAGGVGDEARYVETMSIGYGAVQMGTRFIATNECQVHQDYWDAILKADESDIVLTERLSGVPVSVINTPLVQKVGLKAGRKERGRNPRGGAGGGRGEALRRSVEGGAPGPVGHALNSPCPSGAAQEQTFSFWPLAPLPRPSLRRTASGVALDSP